MKSLYILFAVIVPLSTLYAQVKKTVSVRVNVGGCIGSSIISDADDGNEWELQLVPLDNNGKEIKSGIRKNRVDAPVCDITPIKGDGYVHYFKGEMGPEIQTTIQLSPNQLFKIRLVEKDWGLPWLFGGHEIYELGSYTPEAFPKDKVSIIGPKAHAYTADCLQIKRY